MMHRRLALGGGAVLGLAASALALLGEAGPGVRPLPDEACTTAGAPRLLEATVLNDSPALAIPTRLEIVGDDLVVLDAASDSVLHVVNRHSGALVRSIGRRGRGPGEFHGAWALDAAHEDTAVWVYDASLRRLTLVPLVSQPPSSEHWHMVSLADGTLVTEARWLDGRTLFTTGLYGDARAALYDSSGRRLERLAERDTDPASGQPPQAWQARMVVRPSGTIAALASRYENRLELLTLATGTLRQVEGPAGLSRSKPRGSTLDQIAYVDLTASGQSVVALFSGRDSREYGARAPFGRCLQRFDWDGRLREVFRLDTDALAIAIEPEERFVYALRHEPVPAVVRFALRRPDVAARLPRAAPAGPR